VVTTPKDDGTPLSADALVALCRAQLPAYMVPAHVDVRPGPLARNPNGKIDRKMLSAEFTAHFEESR
jgi:acyl-CoA synthetase (AMP-forming)/AMP-acid ligase II